MTLDSFSTRLREQSSGFHSQAETSTVMTDIFDGRITRADYAALLGQLRWVYAALDGAAASLRRHAVVGGFFDPRLDRTLAIAADLRTLGAPAADPNDHARAYVDRIIEVGRTWPAGLVAHHYTRYLGDLSGGVMIARALASGLGLTPDAGLAFFQFDIGNVVEFKRRYRERLDQLALDGLDEDAFIAEVGRAYYFNTTLFANQVPAT